MGRQVLRSVGTTCLALFALMCLAPLCHAVGNFRDMLGVVAPPDGSWNDQTHAMMHCNGRLYIAPIVPAETQGDAADRFSFAIEPGFVPADPVYGFGTSSASFRVLNPLLNDSYVYYNMDEGVVKLKRRTDLDFSLLYASWHYHTPAATSAYVWPRAASEIFLQWNWTAVTSGECPYREAIVRPADQPDLASYSVYWHFQAACMFRTIPASVSVSMETPTGTVPITAGERVHLETVVDYVCAPGYRALSGWNGSTTCMENAQWSSPLPTCEPESVPTTGTTSTGSTGVAVDLCERQTGSRFLVSTDVRRKYDVPNATACCDYCSPQGDITGWSWSSQYRTCICQNPAAGATREAHSEYTSGVVCPGGCSGAAPLATTAAVYTTGPTDMCARMSGYRFAPELAVRRKYNVPNETACCDFCSPQGDVTGWSWSSVYQTCICQNPSNATAREPHAEYISGLVCPGGCSGTAPAATTAAVFTTGPIDVCARMTSYQYELTTEVAPRIYNVASETACCDQCTSRGTVSAWSWSIFYHTCICQNPAPGAPRVPHSDFISGHTCAGGCSAH